MFCAACGIETTPAARFCAGCGHALDKVAGRSTAARRAPRAFACPHCGKAATPTPYFWRRFNLAKLILLLPFSMLAPLAFFFFRKDRLICSDCRRLLPMGTQAGLLPAWDAEALSGEGYGAPDGTSDGTRLALPIRDPESERLARHGRNHRLRGIALGLSSAGFLGLAAAAGAEAPGVLAASAVLATGSLLSLVAGGRQGQQATLRQQRHQARRILALAGRHQGVLTVTAVASALGLDLVEAERTLDQMVDGSRVDVEISDSGRLTYVFTELRP